jgi:16S rRNA C1402 N4-methylase RsmH
MKRISDKADFFIFLLEKYAEIKNMSAKDVLNSWKEKGLVDYINGMYEQYHTERIENAIQDIERKSGPN